MNPTEITVSARIEINEELHDWLVESLEAVSALCEEMGAYNRAARFDGVRASIESGDYALESDEIMVLLMFRAGFTYTDPRGMHKSWENVFRSLT